MFLPAKWQNITIHSCSGVVLKQTELNWLSGHHTRWERALHLAEAETTPEQGGSLPWRQKVVDDACRKLGATANDITSCEICQERIAECVLNGKDPFDAGIGVRETLLSYGIKINSPSKFR